MSESGIGGFLSTYLLPIVQGGVIVVVGSVARTLFHATERLVRLEEQMQHLKEDVKEIADRCVRFLEQRGRH